MSVSDQTEFFLNFQHFNDLKVQARGKSDAAATAVAQQFEGLFVQQMLASMRSASKINSTQDSAYMDFYQEIYDKQLAQTIAGQERLGVAKLILKQMPGGQNDVTDQAQPLEPANDLEFVKPAINPQPGVSTPSTIKETSALTSVTADKETGNPAVVLGKVVDDDFAEVKQFERSQNQWQSPQEFVAEILPLARSAADALGVSAELLVAQSALETGWGKHTMKSADGRDSNNLFGIKAGSGWQGSTLSKQSLEYEDGVLQHQQASFRAYASPAQSLTDYVSFIQNNPRYQQALQQVGDDHAYIREIHKAGYATDPDYADKVISILKGATLQRSLAGLTPGASDHV